MVRTSVILATVGIAGVVVAEVLHAFHRIDPAWRSRRERKGADAKIVNYQAAVGSSVTV